MLKNFSTSLSILFLIAFFRTEISIAQVEEDSLKFIWEDINQADSIRFKALHKYYLAHSFSQPDSVLKLTKYHLNIANSKDNKEEMAKVLNEMALAFYVIDQPDSSMAKLMQALDITSQLGNPSALAQQNANIGTVYRMQQKYQEAIRYYWTSLKIGEEQGMESAQADILNNIGLVYCDIDNHEMALDYLNRALELYQKLEIQDVTGNIWLNIGSVYFKMGESEKAIAYVKKALKMLEEEQNLLSISDCYTLFAEANQKLNKIDSALYFAQKSKAINEELGNESKVLSNLILIAELTLNSDPEQARKIAEDVQNRLKSNMDKNLKKKMYHVLYESYKRQNNYSLSLEMHEKYLLYYDSTQMVNNSIAITREAIQNEYETILLKNQLEHEQAEAALKLTQLKRTFAIVLISLLLIAAVLLYVRANNKSNRQKRELLLEEIERLKNTAVSPAVLGPARFELKRDKIDEALQRKINDTDWTILNILLDDPVISNQEIANQAFLSVDGIGSSLRRMYEYFEIKESKYKKISLLMEAMKLSNQAD